MKKCLIYGNCQTAYIKNCLGQNSDFSSQYSQVFIKKVHRIKKEEIFDLEAIVSDIDLFIYQPVSDNYKKIPSLGTNYLKSLLKPDCKIISFPVAYFAGYQPEMVYLKPLNNQPIKEDIYNYHDFNILSGFDQGKSIQEIASSIFNESFYSPYYIKNNFDLTIAELAKREKSLDIKITPFILNNYQKINLFNTINHPHHSIIGYVVNRILEILELATQYTELELISGQHTIEYNNYFPIYPSVKKILNLEFDSELVYKFQNNNYSIYEAISKLYEFYNSNQDLIEFNLKNKWERFSRNSHQFYFLKNEQVPTQEGPIITQFNQENLNFPLNKSTVIKQLSDLSDRLKEQKQFFEAIVITKSILELKPKSIKYWQKIANLYESNQEYERGIHCYQQILKLSPNHANTYINLGKLYQKQQCLKSAVKYYNLGINLNSQQPAWVYRFLGNCLQELGYLEGAIAQYNQALNLPSSPPIIYLDLSKALRKQNRDLEADRAYQKAIKLNPRLATSIEL